MLQYHQIDLKFSCIQKKPTSTLFYGYNFSVCSQLIIKQSSHLLCIDFTWFWFGQINIFVYAATIYDPWLSNSQYLTYLREKMSHLEQVKTYPPRSTILSVIRWRLHEFWSDKTHMSYRFLNRIRKSPLIQNKTFLRLLGFKDHKCTSLDWLCSVAPCIEITRLALRPIFPYLIYTIFE